MCRRCLAYKAADRLDVETAATHPYMVLKRPPKTRAAAAKEAAALGTGAAAPSAPRLRAQAGGSGEGGGGHHAVVAFRRFVCTCCFGGSACAPPAICRNCPEASFGNACRLHWRIIQIPFPDAPCWWQIWFQIPSGLAVRRGTWGFSDELESMHTVVLCAPDVLSMIYQPYHKASKTAACNDTQCPIICPSPMLLQGNIEAT